MERGRQHRLGRALLADDAGIHHGDAVRDMRDRRQIMRDEQIGEMQPVAQIGEEVEHGRLDRDVEGRDRFVADHEFWIAGERPRDTDPLALAAAQLVGKARCEFRR